MGLDRKKTWLHEHVVDATLADFVVRTYLELSDIRSWLTRISCELEIRRACDIGAGYGRLTPVLTEFAGEVIAFEREPHFVNDIRRLLPGVEAHRVEQLAKLPVVAKSFQFILSFTVLQHLLDEEVVPVIDEIKRITAQPGYILLCEATDASCYYDETFSPEGGVTIGRSINQYQALFSPLTLIATALRRVEPGYTKHRGTYMLFSNTP